MNEQILDKPILLDETGKESNVLLSGIAQSIDLMSKNMDRELVESDDIEDSAEDAYDSVGNNVLLKSEQILTPEQKSIVRNNIGAASVESVVNKIDKDAPVDDGVDYVYAQDASGNPIRILKSDMVSLIADAIKANATEQAKVTFGASTIQALQTTIGTNLYGAATTDGLATNVAQKIHDNANAQKLVTFGASDAAGLASVVAGQIAITDKVKNEAIPTGGTYASTQLWAGGPYWAKWNVGANSETEYGDLFAWGATKPYRMSGTTVLDNTGDYSSSKAASITTDLKPNEDAATINMGAGWRMPTKAEFDALLANTNASWIAIGGVNGRKFADKRDANNYIFFPASGFVDGSSLIYRGSGGYCWARSFNSSTNAWNLDFYSSVQNTGTFSRSNGFSVRGVRS